MNIKKGEKYYISIDFDGTLFFQNRISSYNIHTIKKFQKKGHKFILNTGRSKGNLPECYKKINWDYYLCGASYIEGKNGEILFHNYLDEKRIRTAFKVAFITESTFSLEGESRNVTYKKEDIMGLDKNKFDELIKEFIEKNKDNPITKVSFWKAMDARIDKKLIGFKVIHHSNYFECFIDNADKGALLDIFMEIENVDRNHLIGIGDSQNDMEMFSRCDGAKVAMHLACDELKEQADYITKRSTSGVGEAIEFLLAFK